MLRPIRIGVLLGLFLAWAVLHSDAQVSSNITGITPQPELKQADLTLVEADMARDKGKRSDATRLYKEALSRYSALVEKYPQWQTTMVKYRITYCSNQLEALLIDQTEGRFSTSSGNPETEVAPEQQVLKTRPVRRQRVELPPEDVEVSQSEPSFTSVSPLSDDASAHAAKKESLRLLRLGSLKESEAFLSKRVDLLRENPDLRVLSAISHCRPGAYEEAIRIFMDILQNNSTNAPAHVGLGMAYAGTGSFNLACNEMEEALRIDPNLSEAHYDLAQILLSEDPPDIESAQAHYTRMLQLGGASDRELEKLLKQQQ